jgi:hypothetical protein
VNLSNWINVQVFQSVARWALDKLGLFLVGAGILNNEQAATGTGALLVLLTLVFSVISARTKSTALKIIGEGSTSTGVGVVKRQIAEETAKR